MTEIAFDKPPVRATATPQAIRTGDHVVVRCNRCGASMKPYIGRLDLLADLAPLDRVLWWTCTTGHTSDAVPLPPSIPEPPR